MQLAALFSTKLKEQLLQLFFLRKILNKNWQLFFHAVERFG
jgi:hypothetical protein